MAAKKTRAKSARKAPAPQPPAEEAAALEEKKPAEERRPSRLSAVPRPLVQPGQKKRPAPEPAPAEPEAREERPPEPEPAAVEESAPAAPVEAEEAPAPAPLPPAGRGESGSLMKAFAVLVLLGAAVFLAYYFYTMPENSFVPGAEVDAETFKGIFLDAPNVYIVMDVRGAGDDLVSHNIMQCGVDFAASSGMGGKTVTPISFGPDGCVAPDGEHPPKDCFAMLKNGVTIYVKEGPGGAKYYSNGMVVSVGKDYALGTCSIKLS